MRDGDAVVHLNFRADRARQLTRALALPGLRRIRPRPAADGPADVVTLTEYQAPDELPVAVAFPPHRRSTRWPPTCHGSGCGSCTWPRPRSTRTSPTSSTVASRRRCPAKTASWSLAARRADLRPCAGDERAGDHRTAAWPPSAQARTTSSSSTTPTRTWSGTPAYGTRRCGRRVHRRLPGRVTEATLAAGGALVFTADHGNIEEMRDQAGAPQTQHTTSPVPLVLVAEAFAAAGCGTASWPTSPRPCAS